MVNRNRNLSIGAGTTLVLLIIVTAIFYDSILDSNQGNFAYGIDDAYIHLAVAKNVVEQGFWGVNPGVPTSSSSSPVWTALLSAIYLITGILDTTPLILNVVFALGVVVLLFLILHRVANNPIAVTVWVNIIIYGAYLPRMIFIGMEHIMHVFFLLYIFKRLLELHNDNIKPGKLFWVTIMLAVGTRYESVILILILSLYFIVISEKKYFLFTMLSLTSSILITGLLSIYADGWFLPNSVLLRRSVFELSWYLPLTLLNNFYLTLQFQYQFPMVLTALFTLVSLLKVQNSSLQKTYLLFFILSAGTAILHAMVGMMVLRYFFYINVLLLLALVFGFYTVIISDSQEVKFSKDLLGMTKAVILTIFCVGLVWNGMMANRKTIKASTNIYDQQIQTAEFIKRFYNFSSIAINDIGAISRYSNAKFVDIAGLADNRIAKLINDGEFNSSNLKERLRGTNIEVIILPEVVLNSLDPDELSWIHVGSWKIVNNVVCASETIHFLASDKSKAEKLAENLHKFNPLLPKTVITKLD